ncbi:hypothetical protein [Nocardia sp. NPDC019395]|uniref:hypothetical protein n=1 Tax=Nocardia sp. NPDC019395 TaxID=3154686 RepID=UPI0033D609AE
MRSGDAFGLTNSPNFLPEYHGADGDTRYPSSRELRAFGASSINFVLQSCSFVAALVAVFGLMLETKFSPPVAALLAFLALLIPIVFFVGNRILLPKLVHASIGESIFGLVEIRSSDGAWPSWRDLFFRLGSRGDGVPDLVSVRRCDAHRN